MSEDLQSAVLISAIGIGLVFGVILILWGLMAVVVRVAAAVETERVGDTARARAAAAAVGAYLAEESGAPDSAQPPLSR